MLYWISVIINFVFLIAAVWLGIYIVSRSPRNLVAWLTGLTLWSVASLFLNICLNRLFDSIIVMLNVAMKVVIK